MKKTLIGLAVLAVAIAVGCGSQVVEFAEAVPAATTPPPADTTPPPADTTPPAEQCVDANCPVGQVCRDNACALVDPCEGVTCPEGDVCRDGA